MPEIREYCATGHVLQWGLDAALSAGANLSLRSIAGDDTDDEAKARGKAGKDNLVHDFGLGYNPKRGNATGQTAVYPTILGEAPLSSLVLMHIVTTYRFVLLFFGAFKLKVQLLTHTSANWYAKDVWDASIMLVDRHTRGFKVGMALVFADRVLAFLSNDNVFQPQWMDASEGIRIPPCVFHVPTLFLCNLATWIETNIIKTRAGSGLATQFIRDDQTMFFGIGAYTVQEVFYLAGIPPFITARELFVSPSRTARFVAAFYTFIKATEDNLVSLLRPAMIEGVLAPILEQRLQFRFWLYVWAKAEVQMSKRLKACAEEYAAILSAYEEVTGTVDRNSIPDLCDPFEPSHIRAGIEALNLGHLVFGAQYGYTVPPAHQEDAITALYRAHHLLTAPTKLKTFEPLFLDDSRDSRILRAVKMPTLAYTAGTSAKIWSIVPDFPPALHINKSIRELSPDERSDDLFLNLVGFTRKVAIGPLEYCGNGHRVHTGYGKYRMAACFGDPRIPVEKEEHVEHGIIRRTGTVRPKANYAAGYARAAQRSADVMETENMPPPPTEPPAMTFPPTCSERSDTNTRLAR
ncbi:hypothetical protein C8F01DRAFT_1130227 [Mycena amicta]|nr:hypothetical protein C8F01DRAFT_1130227 [Mycena amicta]